MRETQFVLSTCEFLISCASHDHLTARLLSGETEGSGGARISDWGRGPDPEEGPTLVVGEEGPKAWPMVGEAQINCSGPRGPRFLGSSEPVVEEGQKIVQGQKPSGAMVPGALWFN